MIFISVDDHVVEPPDMFEGRLPQKYADAAPRVERTESGNDVWMFNGATIPNIGLNAVAGRPRRSTASTRPPSTRCARVATTSTSA